MFTPAKYFTSAGKAFNILACASVIAMMLLSTADTDVLHVNLKEEDFVIGDYTTHLVDITDVRNKLGT